jgi:hypothetical protein
MITYLEKRFRAVVPKLGAGKEFGGRCETTKKKNKI